MKLPLYPEHAEEEKKSFSYICQGIIICDSAGRSCLISIMKLPFHSEFVEEEEYFFFFCKLRNLYQCGQRFDIETPLPL